MTEEVQQTEGAAAMVAIPPQPPVSQEELSQWFKLQQELKAVKASEMLLRQSIFARMFPTPVEGTNNAPLADGWVLKGGYVINREVDAAALQVMREEFTKVGINSDMLVEWKPSLKVGIYKELTAEQRALFDRCLVIKPGSPALKIELPAKVKRAQEAAAKAAGVAPVQDGAE